MDENNKQLNDKNIKVLRTYTSDMADAIRTNEVSVIKIALAEKEKREQATIYKKAEGTTFSKILFFVGGIIFIAAAIFGLYSLFKNKKVTEITQPIIIDTNTEIPITSDLKLNIDVTNINNANDLYDLLNQKQLSAKDSITTLFLEKNINGIKEILNSKDFFSMINSTAPGTLVRSLSNNFTIGKYKNLNPSLNEDPTLFLIFQTNNYGQTYASMLDWEKTMLDDLKILFNIKLPVKNGTDAIVLKKEWRDLIVDNKDTRVIYGENGEGILYYVFVNNKNLLITSNIESLKEVINKLLSENTKAI